MNNKRFRQAVRKERLHTDVDKDFVLFLIGMRFNKIWKVWRWLPVFLTMPRMLKELSTHKALGLLHYRLEFYWRGITVIQYWQSWEQLDQYANAKDHEHKPAWAAFMKKVGLSGDVGIWHETYRVSPGTTEAFYANMPPFGQGNLFDLVVAKGAMNKARNRINKK